MILLKVGHNSGVRYVIFLYAAYAFGTVFINCELCQRITDSFEQINHRIKAFDWYSYPHEMQKLMPIILLGTQKRVYFKFFGDISNLRVTFRKVRLFPMIFYNKHFSLSLTMLISFRLFEGHTLTSWWFVNSYNNVDVYFFSLAIFPFYIREMLNWVKSNTMKRFLLQLDKTFNST